MQVIRKNTPSNSASVAQALRAAWLTRFDEPVSPDILALLLALSDLETASFGSGLWHHNLGNIIVTNDNTPFYMHPEDNHRYRVYSSLEDGADGLILQLTSMTRPQWEAGLLTADPEQFVSALKGHNGGPAYFEAPFERYLGAFLQRYDKYDPKVLGMSKPPLISEIGALRLPLESDWRLLPRYAYSVEGQGNTEHQLPTLSKGASGPAVALLQWLTADLEIDGLFGPLTRKRCVERWGRAIIGPGEWRKILKSRITL